MQIKFDQITNIQPGNIIQYDKIPYTIYDIDKNLVYLKNPELKNIGIPINKIFPILATDDILINCNFSIIDKLNHYDKNNILLQSKTTYKLNNELDFKVSIIIDYDIPYNDIIKPINSIEYFDNKIKYLHQIQNIFKLFYNSELIIIN